MALLNVAGQHGKKLRCTDDFGGCISYPYVVLGDDANFKDQVSLGFQVSRDIDVNLPAYTAAIGLAKNPAVILAVDILWVEIENDGANFIARAKVSTTSCGLITIATYTFSSDAGYHTVALTYNPAGDYHFYVDKIERDTGSAPCANIGEDFDANTGVIIIPGAFVEAWYIDDAFVGSGIATLAEIEDFHDNGLP